VTANLCPGETYQLEVGGGGGVTARAQYAARSHTALRTCKYVGCAYTGGAAQWPWLPAVYQQGRPERFCNCGNLVRGLSQEHVQQARGERCDLDPHPTCCVTRSANRIYSMSLPPPTEATSPFIVPCDNSSESTRVNT
jgi:hypothetical protein